MSNNSIFRRSTTLMGLLLVVVIIGGFFIYISNINKDKIVEDNIEKENSLDSVYKVTTDDCSIEIPLEKIDDSVLNLDGTATVSWLDAESGLDVSKTFPFEPKSDFSGCSESVRAKLREMNEVAREAYGEEYKELFLK